MSDGLRLSRISPTSDRMAQTIEAVIDERGNVRLLEPVQLSAPQRALVTVLAEPPVAAVRHEAALLRERALAEDWNRPEEDAAWQHLQPAP